MSEHTIPAPDVRKERPEPRRRRTSPSPFTMEGATVWVAWAGVYDSRRLVAVCDSELAALRALVGLDEHVDVEQVTVQGAGATSEVDALRELLKIEPPAED